jgi:hypothetical protein
VDFFMGAGFSFDDGDARGNAKRMVDYDSVRQSRRYFLQDYTFIAQDSPGLHTGPGAVRERGA